MLYRISVAERGLTGIANIFRNRLSRLDDLLRAGTVPLSDIFRHLIEHDLDRHMYLCSGYRACHVMTAALVREV